MFDLIPYTGGIKNTESILNLNELLEIIWVLFSKEWQYKDFKK